MTPERIEQERKAFEEWYASTYLPTPAHGRTFYKYPTGVYHLQHTQDAWQTWQARAAQSEWISVEERLPEVNGTYLGFNNNAGMVGAVKFYKCHTGKGLFHDHRILNVTHWQPLPEPPETRGK
ncbi:MAG: DUF551 domain-containing protein [Neisseria elongata]